MAAKKKKSNKASSSQNVDQDESSSIDRGGPAHTKAAIKGEDLMYISPSRVRFINSYYILSEYDHCAHMSNSLFFNISRYDINILEYDHIFLDADVV